MLNLNIADLNIAVYGADCDSFKNSVAKYITDPVPAPDATVTFKLCDDINVEGLVPIRSDLGRHQYIDGEYLGYFDYIEDLVERENTFTMEEFSKSVNEFLEFRK